MSEMYLLIIYLGGVFPMSEPTVARVQTADRHAVAQCPDTTYKHWVHLPGLLVIDTYCFKSA